MISHIANKMGSFVLKDFMRPFERKMEDGGIVAVVG